MSSGEGDVDKASPHYRPSTTTTNQDVMTQRPWNKHGVLGQHSIVLVTFVHPLLVDDHTSDFFKKLHLNFLLSTSILGERML